MDIEKIFKANMKREQSEKIAKYNVLNTFAQKGKILFTGSSLMEQFPDQRTAHDCGYETDRL